MSYIKKAVFGTGIVFAMGIAANFVGYITRMVLARELSVSEYGFFYSVFTFVMFFFFIRDLGLGQAAVKFISELNIKKRYSDIKAVIVASLGYRMASSAVIGGILFILSPFLAERYFRDPDSAHLLNILILYLLFSPTFTILKNMLRGFQRFDVFAFVEPVKNTIVLAMILIGIYGLGYRNAFAPAAAYVLVCPILFLILLPFALRTFPIFRVKTLRLKRNTKKLFSFGIPVMFTGIGSKVIGYIDTIILTYYSTFDQIGIYNVVLPSALLFLYLGSSIGSVAFPIVSELWAKKDKKRLKEGLGIIHSYVLAATIPLIFAVFSFAEIFITLFFGPGYATGAVALKILLVGVLFYIIAVINNNFISGIGRPGTVTKIILVSAAVNAVANLILIPMFGINGAAAATTLSYLAVLVLSTIKTVKFIGTDFPVWTWLKTALLGAVFTAIIYIIKASLSINPWLELLVSVIPAGIIYIALLYMTGIIRHKDIKRYAGFLR